MYLVIDSNQFNCEKAVYLFQKILLYLKHSPFMKILKKNNYFKYIFISM